MYKKGQAALEFLTTYGWAFLVILVMIGALAYFGVLNPENFVSDSCSLGGAHYRCEEANIVNNVVTLRLVNSQTDPINFVSINITDPRDAAVNTVNILGVALTDGGADGVLAATATENIGVSIAGFVTPLTIGDKVRLDIDILYTKGATGLQQRIDGSITATVQG
ncbi:hypothetical protein H8D36_03050 [archaeon]|nr:hypothetical protein [archaeon]MBL7057036.1 hypothetical protein [Candidatus Woesearchaeota archaeon]